MGSSVGSQPAAKKTNANLNGKKPKEEVRILWLSIEKTEYAVDKIRLKFGKEIIKKGRSLN